MRRAREAVARHYREAFKAVEEIKLPAESTDRIHSWHLYPIRLRLERLAIDRNAFIEALRSAGVGCSDHSRSVHMHQYCEETFRPAARAPSVATAVWQRLVSLPIFPKMAEAELNHVVEVVRDLCPALSPVRGGSR